MRYLKFLAVVLLLALPVLAQADASDIPGSATWYFHADLEAMRNGEASKGLYDWLDEEAFDEIRSEIGIDFGKEVERMTAFAAAGEGPIVLVEGNISQTTKDKVLAIAAVDGDLQPLKSSGKAYYQFSGDDDDADSHHDDSHDSDNGKIDIDMGSLEEQAYFSLALKDKIVVTNTEQQMQALLANDGKVASRMKARNTLFVLQAERSLIQAGVNADELDGDDDWDSNILRNTKKIAVLLADAGDRLAIEAQLMTNEAEMAASLASIVRGLISLQVFNDDIEPEVASLLQSTKVDVDGNTLKISLALDPETVVSALED